MSCFPGKRNRGQTGKEDCNQKRLGRKEKGKSKAKGEGWKIKDNLTNFPAGRAGQHQEVWVKGLKATQRV